MPSTLAMYVAVAVVPLMAGWLALRVMHVDPADTRHRGGTGLVGLDMQSAFDSARWRHTRAALVTTLAGRPGALLLPVLARPHGLYGARPTGQRDVPLSEIVGSVDAGRHPFDRHFDPVTDQAWARFASVFAARSGGTNLPPVQLLHASDGYYVVDGHHRVAVARSLGESDIWADVTELAP